MVIIIVIIKVIRSVASDNTDFCKWFNDIAETFGFKVNKYHFIFSVLVEFWYDVFKKLVAEIITETISPAPGIDGAVSFSRKLENSGLIQTITNLLHNLVSTNIP